MPPSRAHALRHNACVVVGAGDVGAETMRAGCRRSHACDQAFIASGKHDGMPRRPRLLHDRRANALTAACDEKPPWFHPILPSFNRKPWFDHASGRNLPPSFICSSGTKI